MKNYEAPRQLNIFFMVVGENREKDLAQLETFVKREKLAGQIVHLLYYHFAISVSS